MTATTDFEIVNGTTVGINQRGQNVNVVKSMVFYTDNEVDATDTIAITLADYGITTVEAIYAWVHTTDNSVVATEADTTAVSGGVLTVTIAAGTDDDQRVVQIFYT